MNNLNKINLLLLIGIFVLPSVFAANWHVSTTSSGDASGNSWANKRSMHDFTAAWYSSRVMPGDTVYIDGGVNNLTYTFADSWNQQIGPNGIPYTTFYWAKSGTPGNKITITRGIEPGHNGVPIIEGAFGSDVGALYVNGDYLEISHLAFSNKDTFNNLKARYCILLYNADYVDILHNEIKYTYGTAMNAGNARNVRVMYNKIYTGPTNDTDTEDVFFFGGNQSRDNEFAYNYILNENNFNSKPPYNDTNLEHAHSDIFQMPSNYQQTGGVTKIHHNFIGNIQDTDGYGKQLFYINQATGTFEIYNNILVQYSRDDNFLGTTDITVVDIVDNNPTNLIVKVYNNVIVSDGRYPAVFKAFKIDELVYKNNLIYTPNIIPGGNGAVFDIKLDTGKSSIPMDVDFNRYYKTDLSRFAVVTGPGIISWNVWRSTYGVDSHSTIGPIEFINVGSTNPADYKLVAGSSGIDEGTPVSGFTDDYSGTTRPQGAAWDVGAYEFVSSTSSSYHPADLNQDGCIDLGEISSYVGLWLNGSGVTLSQVSDGVNEWMNGC
jgi:hypothetical protein